MKKIKNKITVKKVFEFLIQFSIIFAFVEAVLNKDWIIMFITIITFILILTPYMFKRRYKIFIPEILELIIISFIYGALFLGEVHGYYIKLWWWDLLVHAFSGILLGLMGFTLLLILYQGEKIKTNPLTITFFSFCFALALGTIWEIFEFLMDLTFKLNMQKSGLNDTMSDLILDGIGALIISFLGYLYLKNKENFIIKKIINKILRKNKKL